MISYHIGYILSIPPSIANLISNKAWHVTVSRITRCLLMIHTDTEEGLFFVRMIFLSYPVHVEPAASNQLFTVTS